MLLGVTVILYFLKILSVSRKDDRTIKISCLGFPHAVTRKHGVVIVKATQGNGNMVTMEKN
jgi:hypothetical protein